MKYIIHTGISGFGNQLLGFKELCILSKYLNRTIILPVFVPHGTIRNTTKPYYEFEEIFDVEHFKKFYDCIDFKDVSNITIDKAYCIRKGGENDLAMAYFNIKKHYYNIDNKIEFNNLKTNYFSNIYDTNQLDELKSIDDEILVLIGLFDNVKISNCHKNGCLKCGYNNIYKKDYNYVVKSLCFNNTIKTLTDTYLKSKNLYDNNYIAFHLRTPDLPGNKYFKELYNNLDEEMVYQFIINYLFETNNMDLVNKIFVAIPPDGLKIKDMTIFNSNKVILLNDIIYDKFILSLVETEICYRSKILINSPTNTPYLVKEHTRSSFTMQIRDLREINGLNKIDKCITEFKNINYIEIIKEIFTQNKKIISFSLYGNKDIYNYGILLNYELKKIIYKDWIIRLYINDTVNNTLLEYLKTLDIEIYKINSNIPPMFYRFFPLTDNNVEYFISRDLDSIISFREEKMVEEWIMSGKNLHLIHEVYPGHRHIIMGGMFGLKKNLTPNLTKFVLNENDLFHYDPWKEDCCVKWSPTGLKLVGVNSASKNCILPIENKENFLNGEFVEILWHGKDKRQCKIVDNNTILVIHSNNNNQYFRKVKSSIISIDDKNIYNEIINFYIKKKRNNFMYCDDQNFIAEYLSNYLPTCIDHNQMKQGTWDYSIKFNQRVSKLNTIYPNINECYVGHRVDTKKLYEEYFNYFTINNIILNVNEI